MTSPLYTEESSSETAMEGSLAVFWAETIEPENTPIEIKLSKNRIHGETIQQNITCQIVIRVFFSLAKS